MQVERKSRRMQPRCQDRYKPISIPNPIAAMRKLSATYPATDSTRGNPAKVQRRRKGVLEMVMSRNVSDLSCDASFIQLTVGKMRSVYFCLWLFDVQYYLTSLVRLTILRRLFVKDACRAELRRCEHVLDLFENKNKVT